MPSPSPPRLARLKLIEMARALWKAAASGHAA
jgi:hypothetical protein